MSCPGIYNHVIRASVISPASIHFSFISSPVHWQCERNAFSQNSPVTTPGACTTSERYPQISSRAKGLSPKHQQHCRIPEHLGPTVALDAPINLRYNLRSSWSQCWEMDGQEGRCATNSWDTGGQVAATRHPARLRYWAPDSPKAAWESRFCGNGRLRELFGREQDTSTDFGCSGWEQGHCITGEWLRLFLGLHLSAGALSSLSQFCTGMSQQVPSDAIAEPRDPAF